MSGPVSLTEGSVVPASADLARLLGALGVSRLGSHLVALPGGPPARAPLAPAGEGAWRVGSYAGALALDGVRFELRPRIGSEAVEGWVRAAAGLAGRETGEAFTPGSGIAPLVAMVWTRVVDGASRHGPPAFRREVPQIGGTVRGRLDVRRTVRMRAKGDTTVASLYRTRELDNPVTRIIVAADRVLSRQVGHGRWRTQRVEAVLPQLHTAVGRRAPVPGDAELQRMRYTPITRSFKQAAELSARIVRQDPVTTTPQPGRLQGLVIDLAGIWAGAAHTWLRAERGDLEIEQESGWVVVRRHGLERARVRIVPGREDAELVLETVRPGASAVSDAVPGDPAAAAAVVRAAAARL